MHHNYNIVSEKISTAKYVKKTHGKLTGNYAFHIREKGLISLTCKVLPQIENEKTNNIMEKWVGYKE